MFNIILGIYFIMTGLTGLFLTIRLLYFFKYIELQDLLTVLRLSLLWFITIPVVLIESVNK